MVLANTGPASNDFAARTHVGRIGGRMSLPRAICYFVIALMVVTTGAVCAEVDLGVYTSVLNARIIAATADGRAWPSYPGGLAAFLFGADGLVEQGCILFRDTRVDTGDEERWLEADIHRTTDGTWRIRSVRESNDLRVAEALERRNHMREMAVRRSGFDYVEQGPMDLLELLREWKSPSWTAPIMPFGLVKESDLPALIGLLDSTEPCANVQSMLSSAIDPTRSTVGNEAAYLIEGYRIDRYPPRLNSTRPPCDIEEIKQWWERRKGS